MNTIETIAARRSIRKYVKGAKVTDEQVKTLLECAMQAPSACNTRPWEFIVVRDRLVLSRIMEAHKYTGMLATADLAIIICALPGTQSGIASNFFPQDCGAATENILLAAASLGLGACWCGVYPGEERIEAVRGILEVPEEAVPFCVIAVGVPDETPAARGGYEESKVHWDKW